jgi:hypothetical protein
LFCLADAVLCCGGRVTDLARLSLAPEAGRGHGGLYDAVSAGGVDIARLRRALAGLTLPAWPDGRIRLAVDVPAWLRPGAAASPGRMHCHVRGRGKGAQVAPGWPYSLVAALGPGASSWALPLDAVRPGPGDDERAVTAAQLREVVTRLIAAGHHRPGDPPVIVVMDAGYSPVQLAWLLRGLPVTIVARVRSDRVFRRPALPRAPGARGRPARHGPPVRCDDPGACQIFCVSRGSCRPFVILLWMISGAGSDRDAVGERDCERIHSCFPAQGSGAPLPSFEYQPFPVDMAPGDIPDPEVKKLYRCLVGGEMAAVLGYLPQLEVN